LSKKRQFFRQKYFLNHNIGPSFDILFLEPGIGALIGESVEDSGRRGELAEGGLLVVAGDVVPLDAVAVEVVEHGHARLAALAVVGLPDAGASGLRPVVELVRVGGSELDLVGGPVKRKKNVAVSCKVARFFLAQNTKTGKNTK
jgi:hypothetical protein